MKVLTKISLAALLLAVFVLTAPADPELYQSAEVHTRDIKGTGLIKRPAVSGPWDIIGNISGVLGVVGFPLFVASAVIGIFNFAKQTAEAKTHTTVRVWMGYGAHKERDWGGAVPGVCLWDTIGVQIGCSKGGGKVKPGNYHDIRVNHNEKVGNIRPSYISIFASGDDGICLSAFQVTAPDGSHPSWLGDLGAICENQGVRYFLSSTLVADTGHSPACIWLDKNQSPVHKNPQGMKGDLLPILHQGFAFHLDDLYPTRERGASYSSSDPSGNATFPDEDDLPAFVHHKAYCGVPARFSAYNTINIQTQIDVFDPPLKYNSKGVEVDLNAVFTSKTRKSTGPDGYPNSLLTRGIEGAKASKRKALGNDAFEPIEDYDGEVDGVIEDSENNNEEAAEEGTEKLDEKPVGNDTEVPVAVSSNNMLATHINTIVVDRNSPAEMQRARLLCSMATSFGPSFVSVQEGLFCDMSEKQLHPICVDANNQAGCFDLPSRNLHGKSSELSPQVPPYPTGNGSVGTQNITTSQNGNSIQSTGAKGAQGPVLKTWSDVDEWN